MNVEKMLVRLANDGDVSVYFGDLPKEAGANVRKWSVSTLCFGQVGVCVGDNLKDSVYAAYEQVYGKAGVSGA
jgi:hypothetical protein